MSSRISLLSFNYSSKPSCFFAMVIAFGVLFVLPISCLKNWSTFSNLALSTESCLQISGAQKIFSRQIHCFQTSTHSSTIPLSKSKFFFQTSASFLKGLTYLEPKIVLMFAKESSRYWNRSSTSVRINTSLESLWLMVMKSIFFHCSSSLISWAHRFASWVA